MNTVDFSRDVSPEAVGMQPAAVAALANLFEEQIALSNLFWEACKKGEPYV
jgi:hypothetical protein